MAMQSHVCGDLDKGKVELVVPQGGLDSLILGILVVNAIWLEKFMVILKPGELLHADGTSGTQGGLYFAESTPHLLFYFVKKML